MATPKKRLETNAPGAFYVDSSCIDCDTCRWMAPEVFDRAAGKARVHTQPEGPALALAAAQALLSCPTGSIGSTEKFDVRAAQASFPVLIVEHGQHRVYHCGYHSEDSFGAASYLWTGPNGNVLIDSPRFAAPLVKRLEELGGVDRMLLTHQDDVADHADFRRHFGCERVLHADDQRASTQDVEELVHGVCPVELAEDLLVIPVPGHTQGSVCFLAGGLFLFSGDHVAWSESAGRVNAFRGACWYDWETQIESMKRLNEHRFEWILPGHGRRCHFSADEMRTRVDTCIEWMETV